MKSGWLNVTIGTANFPSRLHSRILNLYWAKWALAFVCFSFFFFVFFSGCVCQIKLITLVFWVHVKLFYRIVSNFVTWTVILVSRLGDHIIRGLWSTDFTWLDVVRVQLHSTLGVVNGLWRMEETKVVHLVTFSSLTPPPCAVLSGSSCCDKRGANTKVRRRTFWNKTLKQPETVSELF